MSQIQQGQSTTDAVGDQVSVVVVAAGKSKRMDGVDKIFAPLLGTPLIAHTVEVFEVSKLVRELVLVLPPEKVDAGIELAQKRKWRKVTAVCAGGHFSPALGVDDFLRLQLHVAATATAVIHAHDRLALLGVQQSFVVRDHFFVNF